MSRVRVLRVIARMNVGGPALQVVTLTQGLDPERFEQRLLVGSVDPGEADYLSLRAPEVTAVTIAGLGRSVRAGSDVRAFAQLVGEVRRFRPHIVHTHTAKAGVLGRLAAVAGRAPARVHTFHGHLLNGYFSPRTTRAVVGVERILARTTTRLVAVGAQVRDDLLAAGIGRSDQYVVVPPGVRFDDVPTRADARSALGIAPDVPVVAFVARLTQVKRPDRFVDVARIVAEKLPDTVFLVVGGGELLEETKAWATPLGTRMRFLGWRPDVERIYAAADVTLLTSDNEGMPVSLIEAAVVGCPAVTTRVGSAPEVVLDGITGLVTSADVTELALATVKILGDADYRAKLSAVALDHGRRTFGPERLVENIASLYEDLAMRTDFR